MPNHLAARCNRTRQLLAGARTLRCAVLLSTAALMTLGFAACTSTPSSQAPTFRQAVDPIMPHMGVGNWIVIADASFPKSSHPGWKTIPMNINPTEALRDVLDSVKAYGHVKPVIWLDRELFVLQDGETPGITEYRETVEMRSSNLLMLATVPQAGMMDRLREAARHHRVIIIKTPNPFPYSNIYIELTRANWTAEQEAALRERMTQ